MRIVGNQLLCDTAITPDGCIVTIEDVGCNGTPAAYVRQDGALTPGTPVHALWVHTMGAHECDTVGRRVRVQVLAGSRASDAGDLVFDGYLTVASGVIAIGDARNPDRKLLFGRPGRVRVRVFVTDKVEVVHFTDPPGEYPISGPSDVTVLLPDDAGFTRAIGNATTGWKQRILLRYRGTH